MKNTAQTLEPSLPTQGPGDRLQAARISIGMTLEDVANRMHLSESILSSLEENNFEDITAPIFVKGYLRAYARMVKVDEEEIIRQYSDFYTEGDPPITSTSNTTPEINADDSRVKWVTWLVIIALIGLLTAWWWNRYQQPAQPLSLDSTEQLENLQRPGQQEIQITEAKPEPAAIDPALQQQVISDLAEMAQQGDAQTTALPAAAEDVAPAAADTDSSIELSVPQPVVSDDAPVAQDDSAMMAAEQPAEPPPAGAYEVSADGLVIVVNADTWADISDADGKRLVRDLLRAGRTVTLEGRAPFQVFLGNGYGVSIKYQGEDVDISSQIRSNNTAKVSIGQ